MSEKPAPGTIGWHDLTTGQADELRDFYSAVVGWTSSPIDMGGYADYAMLPPGGGDAAGGICHARGGNADLPAQWLMYVIVADLDASIASCRRLGGEVVAGPKAMGEARYCVIRDPAGAVCGLFQP